MAGITLIMDPLFLAIITSSAVSYTLINLLVVQNILILRIIYALNQSNIARNVRKTFKVNVSNVGSDNTWRKNGIKLVLKFKEI